MTSIFHSGLSKDFSLILNEADDFNVIIQVGENQNIKEFQAHSVILRARSSYFKSAFSTEWITKKNNMIIFNKPNITPIVFEMILKYIYTGELDLTEQSGNNILGLLVATDELLIEELFEHVQDYLIEKQTTWVRNNFVLVLHTVFKLNSCKKLQDYCLESIYKEAQPFITSKNFPLLDKDILYGLLKRNDLQTEEIIVWDCLIKWGIEQTPGLGSKNVSWNETNFTALKKTLSQSIPLIRFTEISSADFFDKVRPFKAIVPDRIYDEVEEFYYKGTLPKNTILPPRTGIESNIIKSKHVNIIDNWINKRNSMFIHTEKYPICKFKLIYRGSRDGINNMSFKNRCNGRVASLVLIKVQNSGKIFGGYSSIGFSSIGDNFTIDRIYGWRWYNASDNFIFSFENNEDIQNMKISRVVNNSKAIMDCTNSGFHFGGGSLCMNDQSLFVNNWSGNYEDNLSEKVIFNIEEIETYILIKK